MIKRIIVAFLILVVGIVVIDAVILPQVAASLARPDLASWTGLGGFLKILPVFLLGGLFVTYILGLLRSHDDDSED